MCFYGNQKPDYVSFIVICELSSSVTYWGVFAKYDFLYSDIIDSGGRALLLCKLGLHQLPSFQLVLENYNFSH